MTTIDARHVATVQRYITAYNSFDIPGMLATLAPEVEFRNVSDGTVTVATHGIEEFERQAISGTSLFQSRQQKIAALSFTADRVVVDISYRAKLAVDLPNGLKAGESIALKGKSIFKFKGELIIFIEDQS